MEVSRKVLPLPGGAEAWAAAGREQAASEAARKSPAARGRKEEEERCMEIGRMGFVDSFWSLPLFFDFSRGSCVEVFVSGIGGNFATCGGSWHSKDREHEEFREPRA
jgi:hypothetical protein